MSGVEIAGLALTVVPILNLAGRTIPALQRVIQASRDVPPVLYQLKSEIKQLQATLLDVDTQALGAGKQGEKNLGELSKPLLASTLALEDLMSTLEEVLCDIGRKDRLRPHQHRIPELFLQLRRWRKIIHDQRENIAKMLPLRPTHPITPPNNQNEQGNKATSSPLSVATYGSMAGSGIFINMVPYRSTGYLQAATSNKPHAHVSNSAMIERQSKSVTPSTMLVDSGLSEDANRIWMAADLPTIAPSSAQHVSLHPTSQEDQTLQSRRIWWTKMWFFLDMWYYLIREFPPMRNSRIAILEAGHTLPAGDHGKWTLVSRFIDGVLIFLGAAGTGMIGWLYQSRSADSWTHLHLDHKLESIVFQGGFIQSNAPATDRWPVMLVLSVVATILMMGTYHYRHRRDEYQDPVTFVVAGGCIVVGKLLGLEGTAILLRVVPWSVLAALVLSSAISRMAMRPLREARAEYGEEKASSLLDA